jgi:hypothetical protein
MKGENWFSMGSSDYLFMCVVITHGIALRLTVPYFSTLLCLMSDDFTRQGESLVLNGFSMPMCIVNH